MYIGMSKNIKKRWNAHKRYLRENTHANSILQSSWNKYGELNFDFYILETCEEYELGEKEIFYIENLNTKQPNGFNISNGGDCGNLGTKLSEETKMKMSISRKGKKKKPFSEEHKKNISLSKKGKKMSDETRKKMSIAQSGENNPIFGKKRPQSVKEKISETRKGVKSTLGIKTKKSSSKYIGVYIHIYPDTFRFGFTHNGIRHHGSKTYRNEIDAAKAYDKYVIDNELEGRPLNFPEDFV